MNSAMFIAIAVSLVVGLAIGFGIFQFILSGKRNKSKKNSSTKKLNSKKKCRHATANYFRLRIN